MCDKNKQCGTPLPQMHCSNNFQNIFPKFAPKIFSYEWSRKMYLLLRIKSHIFFCIFTLIIKPHKNTQNLLKYFLYIFALIECKIVLQLNMTS